jgi:hypothetical protein
LKPIPQLCLLLCTVGDTLTLIGGNTCTVPLSVCVYTFYVKIEDALTRR